MTVQPAALPRGRDATARKRCACLCKATVHPTLGQLDFGVQRLRSLEQFPTLYRIILRSSLSRLSKNVLALCAARAILVLSSSLCCSYDGHEWLVLARARPLRDSTSLCRLRFGRSSLMCNSSLRHSSRTVKDVECGFVPPPRRACCGDVRD